MQCKITPITHRKEVSFWGEDIHLFEISLIHYIKQTKVDTYSV